MDVSIENDPSFAVAAVTLAAQETVLAEGDAMTSMSGNVSIETKRLSSGSGGSTMGKIAGAVGQMLAGESVLVNHLTAEGSGAEVILSPTLPGDIQQYRLDEDTNLIIQSTSYLGGAPGVALSGEWGGARRFFGGEGLFMLRASGTGPILLNAFGGIQPETVSGEFVVDTGHIVAFEGSTDFSVNRVGGLKSTLFSGEGLVCHFQGEGTVFLQTRAPNAFGRAVGHQLPPRNQQ